MQPQPPSRGTASTSWSISTAIPVMPAPPSSPEGPHPCRSTGMVSPAPWERPITTISLPIRMSFPKAMRSISPNASCGWPATSPMTASATSRRRRRSARTRAFRNRASSSAASTARRRSPHSCSQHGWAFSRGWRAVCSGCSIRRRRPRPASARWPPQPASRRSASALRPAAPTPSTSRVTGLPIFSSIPSPMVRTPRHRMPCGWERRF